MKDKPKVLLTASYGPNDLGWGEDQYDVLKSRLSRGHGPFTMASHCHYFALYMLAENINCPATVLENPHWDEFDRELDGGYDYVAFQLKSIHTHKIAKMVRRVKEKCPDAKVIIGGYGVSTLGHPVPGDTDGDAVYIRENADYLCREEGVGFMRKLLDDQPVEREITQHDLPMTGFSIAGINAQARIPVILVSLGCPNACDFCNTSAFFHHKKIYVAEPEQVYRFIKNYQKRLGANDIFINLFDEDFFINTEYVRELGRLLRSDKSTWGVQYFSFGSARSLSQYSVEELRDCGLGAVWIGVESFLSDAGTTVDHYAKRRGEDIKKLFADLHRNGIQTTASLVLGFDFHTPENLKGDIDQFIDLQPMLYQISPLTPCPGTPLYERMSEEDRIFDSFQWKDVNLWKDDIFQLKNFKPGEIRKFWDYAHERIRENLGPPAMQAMQSFLDAHQTLKNTDGELAAYKADHARMAATGAYAVLRSIKRHHPIPRIREKALKLQERYRDEIGNPPLVINAASHYLSGVMRKKSMEAPEDVVSDPPPRWTYYRTYGSGDEIYVRRGHKPVPPKPYKDRSIASRVYFRR